MSQSVFSPSRFHSNGEAESTSARGGAAVADPGAAAGDLSAPDEVHAAGFLYRFEAILEVLPIGIVPEGLRMANSFEGQVTQGLLEGARVWGIDHLLLRRDGVAIIDAQKTISLGDVHLYEHVRAYGLPPAGMDMPPLEALLQPDFEWPDELFPVLGSSNFRAAEPSLRYLNSVVARIDGWFNFADGGLAIETSVLRHRDLVEAPATIRQ